jgi:rare lipoprotein A
MKCRYLAAALAAAAVSSSIATLPAEAASSCGRASWYALNSRTASGEWMKPAAMTAAHRSLPFGTKLRVTNPRNGKSVIVRVNDRGPFIRGRVIDLSKGAAARIGLIKSGVGSVCFHRAG